MVALFLAAVVKLIINWMVKKGNGEVRPKRLLVIPIILLVVSFTDTQNIIKECDI